MNKRNITYKGQRIETAHLSDGWWVWINDTAHILAHKTMRAAHSYARGYINRHPDKFAA